jgi:hypothetical protein
MSEFLLKDFVFLYWERIFLESRRDSPEMLATIRRRIICLAVCHPKMSKTYGIITLHVVLYGVQLVRTH